MLDYAALRVLPVCLYTVRPDQRAVVTSFGRAHRQMRAGGADAALLSDEERERYAYPQVRTISPGGPYFKWPWQTIHTGSVATSSIDLIWDPTADQPTIEAVTQDNLTTGVNDQLRFRVSEANPYAYLFGVQAPLERVVGFFVSVLRARIANFSDPRGRILVAGSELQRGGSAAAELSEGVSIDDLRKNLPLLNQYMVNQYMDEQCRATATRYGIELDAALITEIDPPPAVDHALSAINSTRNQVAAELSTARADAELTLPRFSGRSRYGASL